jgi:hypothetical protein
MPAGGRQQTVSTALEIAVHAEAACKRGCAIILRVVPWIGSVSLAWQKMDLIEGARDCSAVGPHMLPSRAALWLSLAQSADCLEDARDCSALATQMGGSAAVVSRALKIAVRGSGCSRALEIVLLGTLKAVGVRRTGLVVYTATALASAMQSLAPLRPLTVPFSALH